MQGGFRCLCGEPRRDQLFGRSKIGRYHPDQREPNAGSCNRLRNQNAILDKRNISHVPNILRFTIAMVVVLSQTDQYQSRSDGTRRRTRGKLGKKEQEEWWTIGANWDGM